jgi:hypothetical protein
MHTFINLIKLFPFNHHLLFRHYPGSRNQFGTTVINESSSTVTGDFQMKLQPTPG